MKILDLEVMISAQKSVCLKKFVNTKAPKEKGLDFQYLEKVGGKFLLHCNFDYGLFHCQLYTTRSAWIPGTR